MRHDLAQTRERGVTLAQEFADLESNTPLLERMAEMTGGRTYEDDADLLTEAAARVHRTHGVQLRFDVNIAELLGADNSLKKPFAPAALLATVKRCLAA